MFQTPTHLYSAPFDAIADRYDRTFTDSLIGQAQRGSVWKELERTFHAGDRVLEIGCGTGVDACFLAERGVKVIACDSSSRMLAIAARKVGMSGKQNFVETRLLAAEDIRDLSDSDLFDGAFSNFGVLNCVPDLARLARNLAMLLRPGSVALLCLMGPCCLWEVSWHLARGNSRKALRRLGRRGVTARLADGPPVQVYYPAVGTLARTFAPEFRLKSIKGVGVLVPPSYLEHLANRFPRWLRLGVLADSFLGQVPGVRLLADHILLSFERECA